MANKLILQWNQSGILSPAIAPLVTMPGARYMPAETFYGEYPFTEDFALDIKSNFKKAGSVVPSIVTQYTDMMFMLQNLGGTTSDTQILFDLMIWDNTDPIRITSDILFYTRDNALENVVKPCLSLISMTMLGKTDPFAVAAHGSGGKYRVPGLSLSNLKAFKEAELTSVTSQTAASGGGLFNNISSENAKIISISIPGIVKIGAGMVESAKPTFSKEIVQSGWPLWCKLNVNLMSAYPATDYMFEEAISENMGLSFGLF